jgi:hypothetical protein
LSLLGALIERILTAQVKITAQRQWDDEALSYFTRTHFKCGASGPAISARVAVKAPGRPQQVRAENVQNSERHKHGNKWRNSSE